MANMSMLEQEINVLFKLCSKANSVLNRVAINEQYEIFKILKSQSKKVFMLLENHVNSMHVKDFSGVIEDRTTLSKMFYVVLRGVHLFSENGINYFNEDPRSMGSAELARLVFGECGLDTLSDKAPLWMKNDVIYKEAIMYGMKSLHKTLLQNIVRCMAMTLTREDYVNQKTNDYLMRFESYVLFYLKQAPDNQRVYLDYI